MPSSAREDSPRRSNSCAASEVPASTGESSLPALRPCCRYRVQTPGCYSTRTGGPLMDSGGRAYKPLQSQCMQYARILLYISFVLLSFPLRPPVCPLAPRPAPPRRVPRVSLFQCAVCQSHALVSRPARAICQHGVYGHANVRLASLSTGTHLVDAHMSSDMGPSSSASSSTSHCTASW